jgi:hypothetical protein
LVDIAKYTVSVAFRFDKREQRQLDSHLKALEKKFKSFSDKKLTFEINNFSVNQKKLETSLGNALDAASRRVTFEISNFVVNRGALNRAVAGMGGSVGGGFGGRQQLSPEEWNRRTLTSSRLRRQEAEARQAERLQLATMRMGRGGGSTRQSAALGGGIGGALGGGLARAYAPALALAAGGYGLSQLNQRNQQVVSAQLQTQAVVQQAGGTVEQGKGSFEYLRQQANRVGFNYLEAAPDYNKLLAGLTGAGVGLEESQKVFTGFAELARVNKLDKTTQNRLFRALSQVAGKGKLQAEELTGQIAEALPGGTALFAQAYQRQIGGKLTGKEATSALMEAMKKGQVKSDILTFAGQLASERAQPSLGAAGKASQAEQARFQNVVSDMAIVASQSGVEEGFARIFRTLNQGLNESGGLVKSLANGFNEATKFADDLLLFPQSFMRMLEGRDSLVADSLFPSEEDRQKVFEFLGAFKTSMFEINTLVDNIGNGWSRLIGLMDKSESLTKLTNALNTISNAAGVFNSLAKGDYSKVGEQVQGTLASAGKAGLGMLPMYGAVDTVSGGRLSSLYDRTTKSLSNPAEFESQVRGTQAQALADLRRDNFPLVSPYPIANREQPRVPDVKVEMTVNVASAEPEDFGAAIEAKTQEIWERAMLQFPVKE